MRKALLIVAMLLLVTPVMAATTITAVKEGAVWTASDGNKVQTVRIDYSSTVDVRAFALDINIDSNNNAPNFQGIRGFHSGESNSASSPGRGYGIFPSRFRDFIVVTGPNWVDTNYNPTTAWNEPGTISPRTGMGFSKMVVEMGTLFAGDANKPDQSGTLFRFDVNAWGVAGIFNLTIAADTLRGGVVGNDGNAIAGPNFVGTSIVFTNCTTPTNEVGVDKTTAEGVWAAQGFTPITGTPGAYSDTIPANQVLTQDTACVPTPAALNYTYCRGKFPTPSQIIYPTYDPDCNIPIYWAAVAGATGFQLDRSANSGSTWTNFYDGNGIATYLKDTVPVGPNYRYRVRARNADSNSLYMTGAFDCNAILSTCYKDGLTTDPNWAQWRAMGRPDCWCKFKGAGLGPRGSGYQCDGDADQLASSPPDSFRVYTADLGLLQANWKKKLSDITMDPNFTGTLKVTSACADFDHKGSSPPDSFRVFTNDLAIMSANWKKHNSSWTGTDKLPGNCPR